MGMFDYLIVEHDLPDGFDPAGHEFQTKDTDSQWLVRYVLREDGTLWNPEKQEAEIHHGDLDFYTSNWAGSCGKLRMTSDDSPPWEADYSALYDRGKLLRIDGPGWPLVEGVEHVLRADFDRRCDEVRKQAPNYLASELCTEWVHWMGREKPFDAVKLPALGLRLSHLRGHFGSYAFDDYVQNLRDWSGWLAAETGLPEDATDMLIRTQRFLAEKEGAE
mgnify:FL=1